MKVTVTIFLAFVFSPLLAQSEGSYTQVVRRDDVSFGQGLKGTKGVWDGVRGGKGYGAWDCSVRDKACLVSRSAAQPKCPHHNFITHTHSNAMMAGIMWRCTGTIDDERLP